MAATITQGSKVYLIVSITDTLNQLTDLGGTNAMFDVRNIGGSYLVVNQVCNTVGMLAYCLVDTTVNGTVTSPDGSVSTWWTGGDYRLYLKFSTAAEVPRLGPYHFTVDDS